MLSLSFWPLLFLAQLPLVPKRNIMMYQFQSNPRANAEAEEGPRLRVLDHIGGRWKPSDTSALIINHQMKSFPLVTRPSALNQEAAGTLRPPQTSTNMDGCTHSASHSSVKNNFSYQLPQMKKKEKKRKESASDARVTSQSTFT